MNCVYCGTTLKLAPHLRTGKLLRFYLSMICLQTDLPPIKKDDKLEEAVTLPENTSKVWIMSSSLIKNLLLRPLIMNFLSYC